MGLQAVAPEGKNNESLDSLMSTDAFSVLTRIQTKIPDVKSFADVDWNNINSALASVSNEGEWIPQRKEAALIELTQIYTAALTRSRVANSRRAGELSEAINQVGDQVG